MIKPPKGPPQHATATLTPRKPAPARHIARIRSTAFSVGLLSRPRASLIVTLGIVVLANMCFKRARSAHSYWSLPARVTMQESASLLHYLNEGSSNKGTSAVWSVEHPITDGRLPGEFEQQQGLLLSGYLAEKYGEVFSAIVDAVPETMRIIVLVSDHDQRDSIAELAWTKGLCVENLTFLDVSHVSKWVRDFAPRVLLGENSPRAYCLDTGYYNDRHMPANRRLAGELGLAAIQCRIHLDGGNFLSNGKGLCLTTNVLLNANPQRKMIDLTKMIGEAYGVNQIVVLEPLEGERTGHVDMFATFTSQHSVVVGSYNRAFDPENAAILDRNAERLANVRTSCGFLQVSRIPMPANVDGKWRSYTNVLYANGILLLPVYESSREDEARAVNTYLRLLPGWTVVRVSADHLIEGGGALHCVGMNLASVGSLHLANQAKMD